MLLTVCLDFPSLIKVYYHENKNILWNIYGNSIKIIIQLIQVIQLQERLATPLRK